MNLDTADRLAKALDIPLPWLYGKASEYGDVPDIPAALREFLTSDLGRRLNVSIIEARWIAQTLREIEGWEEDLTPTPRFLAAIIVGDRTTYRRDAVTGAPIPSDTIIIDLNSKDSEGRWMRYYVPRQALPRLFRASGVSRLNLNVWDFRDKGPLEAFRAGDVDLSEFPGEAVGGDGDGTQ